MSEFKPDIAVIGLDVIESEKAEIISHIRSKNDNVRVLLYSTEDELFFAQDCLDDDIISGYISKNRPPSDLVHALNSIVLGGYYFEDDTFLDKHEIPKNPRFFLKELSPQQLRVFEYMAVGHTSKAIAGYIRCSQNSMGNHFSEISEILKVYGRNGLIVNAAEILFGDTPKLSWKSLELTENEKKVFTSMGLGKGRNDIARIICMSKEAVSNTRGNIMEKLDSLSIPEAYPKGNLNLNGKLRRACSLASLYVYQSETR